VNENEDDGQNDRDPFISKTDSFRAGLNNSQSINLKKLFKKFGTSFSSSSFSRIVRRQNYKSL